jgi:anti-sigma B factor antagonist
MIFGPIARNGPFRQASIMTPSPYITVSTLLGHALVTVTGDIQLGSTQSLTQRLDHALDLTTTAVIIDMSEVGFCDAQGLNAFTTALHRARAKNVTLLTCGLSPQVARIFTITGLDEVLHPHPDLESAVTHLEFPAQHSEHCTASA